MTGTASDTSDDTYLDEEWLAAPRHRSRQRAESTTSATGPGGLPDGVAGGLPNGPEGFPGGGQLPGGGTGDDTADDTDAVVGTVVSIDGSVWTVEDLGGTTHEVRITDDSDLVRETSLTADEVAVGDRVDISGTTSDGHLTAEDVTLR